MIRINWSRWLDPAEDDLLIRLHAFEELLKRAIGGIWLFMGRRIPALCRRFLQLLRAALIYLARIATRLVRIGGLAATWLLILVGPWVVHPDIFTVLWAVLAVIGSWWGLSLKSKDDRLAVTGVKGVQLG